MKNNYSFYSTSIIIISFNSLFNILMFFRYLSPTNYQSFLEYIFEIDIFLSINFIIDYAY